MALSLTITDAGRAALINAANTGTAPVVIAKVGLSATAVAPTPATSTLPGEFKQLATLSGDIVADDTIHIIVRDEGSDIFTVRSFALYLADGTLFAVYGQAAIIAEKSAQALLLLAIDVKFEDVNATAITFGNANFLNPPATTTVQGVVELATDEESSTGTDAQRAVTPKGMKSAVSSWINARFGDGAPSAFVKGLLTAANQAAMRLALGIRSAALKDEGTGNGLDADMLDGQHGSYYANITARLGYTPWGPFNDGAGSGLDADLLDGQDGSYYTNITGRLGYTPINKAGDFFSGAFGRDTQFYLDLFSGNPFINFSPTGSITYNRTLNELWLTAGGAIRASLTPSALQMSVPVYVNGNTVWHAGNDGSGSGLDADLLDGLQASDFLRDIGSSIAESGYLKLSNGLILQWGTIAGTFVAGVDNNVTFPVSFPNATLNIVGANSDVAAQGTAVVGFNYSPPPGPTGFAFRTSVSGQNRLNWMAIGR